MAINFYQDMDNDDDDDDEIQQPFLQTPILVENILNDLVENWGFVDGGDLIGTGRSTEFVHSNGTSVYFEECLEDNPIVNIPSSSTLFHSRNEMYWHTVSYHEIWDDDEEENIILNDHHSWTINVSLGIRAIGNPEVDLHFPEEEPLDLAIVFEVISVREISLCTTLVIQNIQTYPDWDICAKKHLPVLFHQAQNNLP